jgi:hypothetical protein
LFTRTNGQPWTRHETPRISLAVGTVIELAIDLAVLGLREGLPVSFFVTVYDVHGAETERHPTHRPLETTVPDASFAARNWRA